MLDRIRRLLLLLILSLVAVSGYYIFKNYIFTSSPLKIKLSDSGIDVEIEKFKVTHEVAGRKDWILNADYAKINRRKKITHLKNVELEFFLENDHKFWVSADRGIFKNNTKNFELEGNVKLIADPKALIGRSRFQQNKKSPKN